MLGPGDIVPVVVGWPGIPERTREYFTRLKSMTLANGDVATFTITQRNADSGRNRLRTALMDRPKARERFCPVAAGAPEVDDQEQVAERHERRDQRGDLEGGLAAVE